MLENYSPLSKHLVLEYINGLRGYKQHKDNYKMVMLELRIRFDYLPDVIAVRRFEMLRHERCYLVELDAPEDD